MTILCGIAHTTERVYFVIKKKNTITYKNTTCTNIRRYTHATDSKGEHIHTQPHTHTHAHKCTYVCIYACMRVFVYASMHARECAWLYTVVYSNKQRSRIVHPPQWWQSPATTATHWSEKTRERKRKKDREWDERTDRDNVSRGEEANYIRGRGRAGWFYCQFKNSDV